MRLPQEHRPRACGGTPRRGPEAEGGQSWGGMGGGHRSLASRTGSGAGEPAGRAELRPASL